MQVLGRRSEQYIWQKLWRRISADQRSKHSSAKTKRAKFDNEESYKTFARRHHRRRHNEYLKQQVAKGWEDMWDTPKGAAKSRQADHMAASLPDEQLWFWMAEGSAGAKTDRQQRKAWRAWTKQFHESESYAHQYQASQDHSAHTSQSDKQSQSTGSNTWQHSKQDNSNWERAWQTFEGFQESTFDSWQQTFKTRSKKQNQQTVFSVQEQRCMQILGLSSTSGLNASLIRAAFLECAKKWHPDRHSDETKPTAENKFKEAQTAYQHLLTCV